MTQTSRQLKVGALPAKLCSIIPKRLQSMSCPAWEKHLHFAKRQSVDLCRREKAILIWLMAERIAAYCDSLVRAPKMRVMITLKPVLADSVTPLLDAIEQGWRLPIADLSTLSYISSFFLTHGRTLL